MWMLCTPSCDQRSKWHKGQSKDQMKKTESENEHSEVECTTCEKRHHYSLVQRCNCDATILKISTRLAHAARLGFFYKKKRAI